jgi:hypothetical protein
MAALTLGEILDRTIQLYRRKFLLFIGISTPAAGITMLVSGAVVLTFSSSIFSSINAGAASGKPAPPTTESVLLVFGVLAALFLIGLPILLATFAAALGALNSAAYRTNRGESATVRDSYGFAFLHFWRYLGILFLQALLSWIVPSAAATILAVIAGILATLLAKTGPENILGPMWVILAILLFLVLIVVSVLLWLRFSLAYPASITEGTKAWPSMQRSGQLSRGTRGRILALYALLWVLSLVVSLALAIPVDIIVALIMRSSFAPGHSPTAFLNALQIVNLGTNFLVRSIIMPVYSIALLLFYNDQRTRLEGYDIEQLMETAGWSSLPPAPTGGLISAAPAEGYFSAPPAPPQPPYSPEVGQSAPIAPPLESAHPPTTHPEASES